MMPRDISPALRAFEGRLKEVNVLLDLCKTSDAKLAERMAVRTRDETLCRAAIILLCSHMEGFFEDLVTDVLKFHECNKTAVAKLPSSMRVYQLDLVTFAKLPKDHKKLWGKLQKILENPLASEESSCDVGVLDASLQTKGFAVPGSGEVEVLFESIGLEKVWDSVGARGGNPLLKSSLDAVVARRHPMAHGNVEATAAPDDVRGYVMNMDQLSILFDDVVAEHLEVLIGCVNPWGLIAQL